MHISDGCSQNTLFYKVFSFHKLLLDVATSNLLKINGVLYLACDLSSYVTGTELTVDAGYVAQ